jgi:hypothetical protein
MMWESVLFGVGIVVGFTLGGAVLYGLSWVVLGAVWLFIGDDSPIVCAWRRWRKQRGKREYVLRHIPHANGAGCAICGRLWLDPPGVVRGRVLEHIARDGSRAFVSLPPPGVPVTKCKPVQR